RERPGDRLAGAKQRLRGNAGVVGALAGDQLALDHRDLQPALREVPGAVLARRSGPDHDHVVVGAHRTPPCFAGSPRSRRASPIRQAALISPMWLKAWGKLPSSSPLAVSTSSASRPRSFAYPTSWSNSASARSTSPASARHETSQNEQMTKVPSSPVSPSAFRPSSLA